MKPFAIFLILLSFLSLVNMPKQAYATNALESIEWEEVYKLKNSDLNSVAYGNGKFVAVGQDGAIKVSYSGDSWVDIPSKTSDTLNKVEWLGDRFVAVGNSGAILFSNDGLAWESRTMETKSNLLDIAFSRNALVAVGSNGNILSSKDGVKWTKVTSGTDEDIKCILCNDNKFLAVSEQGLVLMSNNGDNWEISKNSMGFDENYSKHYKVPGASNREYKKLHIYDILYGENGYTATGMWDYGPYYIVYTSIDGQKWEKREYHFADKDNPGLKYMLWDGNKIVSDPELNGIAWNRKIYIGVGNRGTILASEDGIKWDEKVKPYEVKIKSIEYNKNLIVAVGRDFEYKGAILVSSNGRDWRRAKLPGKIHRLNSVVWGDGKFIACGNESILISYDGDSWTSINDEQIKHQDITDIIWMENQFVAIASMGSCGTIYSILTSEDGTKWTQLKDSDLISVLHSIAPGLEKFSLKRDINSFMNKKELNSNKPKPGFTGTKMVWDGIKYIAHDWGKICTSKDALIWEESVYAPMNNLEYFIDLEWDGRQLIALGIKKNTNEAVTLVSLDGTNWRLTESGKGVNPYLLKWCEGELIAIDQSGKILLADYKRSDISVQEPVLKSRFEESDKEFSVIMDGKYLNPNSAVKLINNRLFITLGGFGYSIGNLIKVDPVKNIISYNSKEMKTEIPIQIINNETYIPLRDIAKCMGYKVLWDSPTKTASLVKE